KPLTGKNYLQTGVSGKTLTIKTKNKDTVFATGFHEDQELLVVKDDAFTTKGTNAEVTEFKITNKAGDNSGTEVKTEDRAKPILANDVDAGDDEITFVFTEAIELEGDEDNVAKQFRTSGAADKSSNGNTVGTPAVDTSTV